MIAKKTKTRKVNCLLTKNLKENYEMWVSKIKEEEKLNALPTAEEEEEEELEEEDTVSIKSFLNGISRSNTDRKRGGE